VRRGGGALERWIEVERAWDGGRLVQRFILRRDDPLLTVTGRTEGRAEALTASFDLAVSADSAWFELPYGAGALPTAAGGDQSFTPRLRWSDLSAAGFGVSLFSDGPVVWDVRRGTVRLALTAGGDPAPRTFRYALYAHGGDWRAGGTTRRAEELTAPLLTKRVSSHRGPAGHAWSLLTLDAEHVYVGAVKRAQVGRAVVVRLVEGQGRAGRVTLSFARRMARVRTANLLEDPLSIVPLSSEHTVTLSLAPWEIMTILIDETS
jgi:alpha-mannosidase